MRMPIARPRTFFLGTIPYRGKEGHHGLLLADTAARAVFLISVFLALLAVLVRYAHVAIPVVSAHSFETLLAAFLLLLAGNLFKGF
jgi:hypothetical protein